MSRVLTRRRFALAGPSAAAIPLLAACSAPAPSSPTAAAKPTEAPLTPTEAPKPAAAVTAPAAAAPAPTTAPAVVAAPQAGTRIINVAMDADPVSFDCHVQTNFSSAQGSEHFYEH